MHTSSLLSRTGAAVIVVMIAMLAVCGVAPAMAAEAPCDVAQQSQMTCSVTVAKVHQDLSGNASHWAAIAEVHDLAQLPVSSATLQAQSHPLDAEVSAVSLPLRA